MTRPRGVRIPHYSTRLVREPGVRRYALTHASVTADACAIFQELIGDRDTEHLGVLFLNSQHAIVGSIVVAIGGISEMRISPRDVFKGTILANASALILGHNHPSNLCSPSEADDRFTGVVRKAADIIGIPLLDHVIVTPKGGGCYSYFQENKL